MSDGNIQRDAAAGGRSSSIHARLIDLMAHPLAAVLPAASTLLFGLATGFFLLALRQENLGAGHWIALFGFGLAVLVTTGGREMGRDRLQRQQTGELRHAIRDVLEVAQTMPPRTFLGDFDELYRRESTATAVMVRGFSDSRLGEGDAALRQRVDHCIRSVLDALLDLAWIWDETPSASGLVYRVNVMTLVPRSEFEAAAGRQRADILRAMALHAPADRGAELTDPAVTAMLVLQPELSTNSRQRQTPNPDDLEPLALPVGPILKPGTVEDSALAWARAANLPGAPTAVALTRMDYVETSADIARHCREHLLYTSASRNCVEAFYKADAKGRSIVSFPIQGYTGGGETRPNTIGAVNIYRNRHGIMGGAKRAQQFALVTGPFRDLLFRLLQVRNELDQRLVGPE